MRYPEHGMLAVFREAYDEYGYFHALMAAIVFFTVLSICGLSLILVNPKEKSC